MFVYCLPTQNFHAEVGRKFFLFFFFLLPVSKKTLFLGKKKQKILVSKMAKNNNWVGGKKVGQSVNSKPTVF